MIPKKTPPLVAEAGFSVVQGPEDRTHRLQIELFQSNCGAMQKEHPLARLYRGAKRQPTACVMLKAMAVLHIFIRTPIWWDAYHANLQGKIGSDPFHLNEGIRHNVMEGIAGSILFSLMFWVLADILRYAVLIHRKLEKES